MGLSWFDLVILVLIIFSLIRGYMSGLVKQLASLVGLIVCAVFAGQVASFISPYLINITSSSGYIIKPLSYVVAFVIIMLFFLFLGKLIESFLKAIKINTLNKLAGSVFSVAKWLIIASILLNIVIGLDKDAKLISQDIRENSYSYTYVKAITPYFIPFLGFDTDGE